MHSPNQWYLQCDTGMMEHSPETGVKKINTGNNIPASPLYGILRGVVPARTGLLVLPFLRLKERLRLSECAKPLNKYRKNLPRVSVVAFPSPNPAARTRIVRMLSEARVEYLSTRFSKHRRKGSPTLLKACWILPELQSVVWSDLKTLRVQGVDTSSADHVAQAINKGCLVHLEALILEGVYRSDTREPTMMGDEDDAIDVQPIWNALEMGGCPNLKRLILCSAPMDETSCRSLARALSSSHCRGLEELAVAESFGFLSNATVVLRAIRCCPKLRRLVFVLNLLLPEHGSILGGAIKEGSLGMLRELNVSGNRFLSDGIIPILEGLEGKGCPNMKTFDMPFDEGTMPGMSVLNARQQINKGNYGIVLRALREFWESE